MLPAILAPHPGCDLGFVPTGGLRFAATPGYSLTTLRVANNVLDHRRFVRPRRAAPIPRCTPPVQQNFLSYRDLDPSRDSQTRKGDTAMHSNPPDQRGPPCAVTT